MSLSRPRSGLRTRIVKAADVHLSEKPVNLGFSAVDGSYDEITTILDIIEEPGSRETERQTLESLRAKVIAEGRTEAGLITAAAKAEAKKVVDAAVREAGERSTAITEEAYAKGFEEGVAEGRSEGARLAEEGKTLLEDARLTRETMIQTLEPELVSLVTQVAEKLLKDRAAFDPEVVLTLIRAGLAETEAFEDIKIRVSSDDFETVTANKDELQKNAGGAKLEIVRDLSLNKSDCIIETEYGYIDSSLNQQLESLKEQLFYIRDMNKPGTFGNTGGVTSDRD